MIDQPFFGLGALYILSVTLYITHGSAIFWDGALYYLSVTLYITHGSAIFGMGALCILSDTFYMTQSPSQSYIRLLPFLSRSTRNRPSSCLKGKAPFPVRNLASFRVRTASSGIAASASTKGCAAGALRRQAVPLMTMTSVTLPILRSWFIVCKSDASQCIADQDMLLLLIVIPVIPESPSHSC